MTIDQQEQQFETYISRCKDMMLRKGSDYANADRLSSFKLSGAIIGQSAEQSCLNHIATKVSRLGQLIGSGKTAQNESLADTVLDLTCYSILLNMILNEKEHSPNSIRNDNPGLGHSSTTGRLHYSKGAAV